MKLLIHACCTDCLLKMVESIKKEKKFEEIVVYYYNPNIHPRSEYQSRLKAMQLMIKDVKLIIPDWKPGDWFETQSSPNPFFDKTGKSNQNPSPSINSGSPLDPPSLKLRTDKQDGKSKENRCPKCWELRLEKTAEFAKKNGFDAFSSTLLTSEYQDSDKIQKIGEEIGEKYGIEFLIPKNICKKLETKGFYKQVFCGCCYSLTERFEEKF